MDRFKRNSLVTLPTPPISPTSPTHHSAAHPCSTLRWNLELEFVPRGVHPDKKFIPKSRVAVLLTKDRIEEVLRCQCPDCQDHQSLSEVQDISITTNAILGHARKSRRPTTGAVLLFALLVYSECPSLINCFLKKKLTDHDLESSTSEFDIKRVESIFGSHVNPLLAERFHWRKYKFFVPQISGSDYQVYSQDTILPFVNETQIGRITEHGDTISEGNFGKVFAFEVLDGYGGFPDLPSVRRFARKELSNTPYKHFKAELKNLESVKRLQDDHLVKIVKAYKHGDVYNLLFPLAKTSLRSYLRDPEYRPYCSATSLVDHPVWQQLLGLARGLQRVHDFEDPTSTADQSVYGYHLDLKPANILVEDSERLVITDFGQAEFRRVVGATSSRLPGRGGTETYAPPEIDHEEVWSNRKYDVWSLGCVFLEVVTFVVKGQNGVRDLDRIRVSRAAGTLHTDDRFFRHNPRTDSYEIKPAILDHMQSLLPFTQNQSESTFLKELLQLILRMLRVDPNSRLTSSKVGIYLGSLLNKSKSHLNNEYEDTLRRAAQSPCLGFEFGNELLQRLQPISFSVNRYWESGHIQFMQNGKELWMQKMDSEVSTSALLGSRSNLRLVPEYALCSPGLPRFSDATLCLLSSEISNSEFHKFKFNFAKNIAFVAAFQEVLTGQKVIISGKVKDTSIAVRQRKLRVKSLRSKKHTFSPLASLDKVSAVQLWKESSHADITLAHMSDRQSPRSRRPIPPHRRIVIFYDRSILIIRVAKNVRLQPAHDGDDSCTSLAFIPTDTKKDPSFPVYLLQRHPGDERPSFPLDKESFDSKEEECKQECSSLTIEFHSASEATSFRRFYKCIKKEWAEEWSKLETLYSRVSSDFGYARHL